MKRTAQLAVFVLCVGFTIASIVNVFFDNTEVEQMAKALACEAAAKGPAKPSPTARPRASAAGAGECSMAVTRMSRTPIGQSFELTGNGSTHRIRCTRSLIFVGSYGCAPE